MEIPGSFKPVLNSNYQVVVVGGGVNGLGLTRDLALRGVKVLLLEKNDFGAGTSGQSSGMIHGGPRYLIHDAEVTKLACLDSGFIQKSVPHLLFRIPFLYTIYQRPNESLWQAKLRYKAVASFFSTYDRFVKLKNGCFHAELNSEEVLKIDPRIPEKNLVGAVSFDEWGIDVARLCATLAVSARDAGATVLNHTKVTSVKKENNKICGVFFEDQISGQKFKVSTHILVNATGPWGGELAKMCGLELKIRGGKGIHIFFDGAETEVGLVTQAIDGREVFFLPFGAQSMLGTTDDDYFDSLDEQRVSEDEIQYLFDAIESMRPDLKFKPSHFATSGVRPTLYARGMVEDALSREHRLIDHAGDAVHGFISMTGGKLASFRWMAEEAGDLICQKLNISKLSLTKDLPLLSALPVSQQNPAYLLTDKQLKHLYKRHGERSDYILQQMQENGAQMVCNCLSVSVAEIQYCIDFEQARTLADLRRRTGILKFPCQGGHCLFKLCDVLNITPGDWYAVANEFWWNEMAVQKGLSLANLELRQAYHLL